MKFLESSKGLRQKYVSASLNSTRNRFMADNEQTDAWERVAAVLARELPVAELRAELEETGVRVDQGVERLRAFVRRAYQQAAREESAREMQEAAQIRERAAQEVSSWSFAQLREWLQKATAGAFGSDVAELALAYYRNKQAKDFTEAEARSLIADILAAKK
jgi:hypothetical protein